MPRQPRIDAPGLLNHVISRGIERREIFKARGDYHDFIKRIEVSLKKSPCQILAWSLMPNHFHILIRSGKAGISTFMRRLMSGYAVSFNARHKRAGYLFQNRFKSIVCEEDVYLKELVRYIHLNPLRAGIVKSMDELKQYPFSGHAVLMGEIKYPWQECGEVLELFGEKTDKSRERYEDFVEDGIKEGRRSDLTGGGLKRSLGTQFLGRREKECYDSRILGSGNFVENILKEIEKDEQKINAVRSVGWDDLVKSIAKVQGIEKEQMFERGRQQAVSDAKAMLIYAGIMCFEKTNKEMAMLTRMAGPPASRAKERGKMLLERNGLISLVK